MHIKGKKIKKERRGSRYRWGIICLLAVKTDPCMYVCTQTVQYSDLQVPDPPPPPSPDEEFQRANVQLIKFVCAIRVHGVASI